ncbi:hypothetical protein [Streptomyces hainanensis]|uniref:Uncharacterized protein n=1 Tax=Streptomyces hainanensis TaxID=402648 RepID=A0A4V2Y013_9ACTN|nr:hypothetical protein [Streptomyces hainanensis]TDC63075.1 hypothetical protein E1283_32995 [Streptomyces hainanensis]
MRTTDPFEFIDRHRDTIFRVLGIIAVLLVVFLVVRFFAMRLGGWRKAWRRMCHEFAVTGHAFAAPVRAWLRYRRSLRALVRGLRAPATWRDAERAVAAAREAGGQAYGALVDGDSVTVLVAGDADGGHLTLPDDQRWWLAADAPDDHWSVARADLPPVVPVPDQVHPVLVAVGEIGGRCAFLDLAAGPPMVSAEGDRRSAVALHQAVAAQLDVRLPEGLVVVAEGVHRAFAGTPIRAAHRAARELRPTLGLSPVLVTAELPDPVPAELSEPPEEFPALRLLLLGEGRGHQRTLLTDRHGQISVVGTPLLTTGNALSRAIAKVLSTIPPVLPPAPPAGGAAHTVRTFAESDDEEETAAGDATGASTADADAWAPSTTVATAPRPPRAELEEESDDTGEHRLVAPEPDADTAPVSTRTTRETTRSLPH